MAKLDLSINLLDNKGKKFIDQFLDWAIAIGRLLIIITETIALSAFLYRFSIDRQLIDLNDEIKKNESIVAYFKTGEDTYLHAQTKLSISKTQMAATANTVSMFQTMMQLSRGHAIKFNNFSVTDNFMQLAVQASSTQALSDFLETLKINKRIDSINIDKVENRTSSAVIIVTLSVTLKPAVATQP